MSTHLRYVGSHISCGISIPESKSGISGIEKLNQDVTLQNPFFATLMCLRCIFGLQDPLASGSAPGLFQHGDGSQHLLKLRRRPRRVTEAIEMVDQHLGINSPTLGDDIIA